MDRPALDPEEGGPGELLDLATASRQGAIDWTGCARAIEALM